MQRLSSLLILLLVTFAALLTTSCVKATDPAVIPEDIDTLSVAIGEVHTACTDITVFTVEVDGPRVFSGLRKLATSIVNFTAHIIAVGPKPLADEVALIIVDLLAKLATLIKNLCDTLIEKRDFLAPLGIRVVIQTVKAGFDRLLLDLIKIIPTRHTECEHIRVEIAGYIQKVVIAY